MATQSVSDAVVTPQSQGTGLASNDDANSAATVALLSKYRGGEYHSLSFSGHDATNDTVDVGPGYAFVRDDSGSTTNDRGTGGNAQAQSTGASGFDTELPTEQVYLVVLPTAVTISCTDSTANKIWLNVTDVTSNNSVEIRSDGGGGTTAEPGDTFLTLGEVNPDDDRADVIENTGPATAHASVEIVDRRDPRPDADIVDTEAYGGRVANSQLTTGTLIPTTPTRLIPTEESGITSTTWTEIGSLYYGWLESPPSLVPILRGVFDVESGDSGESVSVRVRHQTNDGSVTGWFIGIESDTGTSRQQITDQVYINEDGEPGTGYQGAMMKFLVEAKVSGGTTGGTVYPSSSLIVEHEVL